ncbi:MAG: hypothetical protein HQK87_04855 [Nitrospinae bacterium]|nr:hypothetical protein [Nitrospinota bacterium]
MKPMRSLIPLLAALAIAACGATAEKKIPTGGTRVTPTPEPTATGGSCVESHTPPAGYHIARRDDKSQITVELCDQGEKVNIRNTQLSRAADGNTGAVNLAYGKFTGYMNGIGDYDEGRLAFYVLFHGVVADGRQQNIHAGLWGPQPFNNRLVRHWWAVEGLHPEISQTESGDIVYDPSKTYRFEINWDAVNVSLQVCEGGTAAEVASVNHCGEIMRRQWGMPMKKLAEQEFLFGNRILKGFSFGNSVQVKGVRFTVFDVGVDPDGGTPTDGGGGDGTGGGTDGGTDGGNVGGGRTR